MSEHTTHTITRIIEAPFREAVLQMVDRARDLAGGKEMTIAEYKADLVGFVSAHGEQLRHTITFRIEDE